MLTYLYVYDIRDIKIYCMNNHKWLKSGFF